jgi:hypothetical protein
LDKLNSIHANAGQSQPYDSALADGIATGMLSSTQAPIWAFYVSRLFLEADPKSGVRRYLINHPRS